MLVSRNASTKLKVSECMGISSFMGVALVGLNRKFCPSTLPKIFFCALLVVVCPAENG